MALCLKTNLWRTCRADDVNKTTWTYYDKFIPVTWLFSIRSVNWFYRLSWLYSLCNSIVYLNIPVTSLYLWLDYIGYITVLLRLLYRLLDYTGYFTFSFTGWFRLLDCIGYTWCCINLFIDRLYKQKSLLNKGRLSFITGNWIVLRHLVSVRTVIQICMRILGICLLFYTASHPMSCYT